jgi:hypothetical protein
MSDQPNVTPALTLTSQVQPTATTPVTTGGKTYTEAELEQIIKDRLGREKVKSEKAVQEAADRAAQEAAAKNGEWEKVAKANEAKLAELQGALKNRELLDLKRTIAERIGLDPKLASRLNGDTEADIETDAKALLETLPKQPKPGPGIVTNPGPNATPQNTENEMLQRIHHGGANVWGLAAKGEAGGGFVINE